MPHTQIRVERFSLVSAKPFGEVLAAVDGAIGHPDMASFRKQVTAAGSFAEMEKVINGVVGSAGLMEFARYDLGEFLRKAQGAKARQSVRLVAGNPLIMKRMVEHVPDAGSYAPITILIDERADGVHLSYDRMASFLASYENEEALRVARELDAKVEGLLVKAAG